MKRCTLLILTLFFPLTVLANITDEGPDFCPPVNMVREAANKINGVYKYRKDYWTVGTSPFAFQLGGYDWVVYLRGIESDTVEHALEIGKDKVSKVSSPLTSVPVETNHMFNCEYITEGTLVFAETPFHF